MAKEFASLRRLIGERQGSSRTAKLQSALDVALAADAPAQASFHPNLAGAVWSPTSLPWRFSLPYQACR